MVTGWDGTRCRRTDGAGTGREAEFGRHLARPRRLGGKGLLAGVDAIPKGKPALLDIGPGKKEHERTVAQISCAGPLATEHASS